MLSFFRHCPFAAAILLCSGFTAHAQTVFFKAPANAPAELNVQVLSDEFATVPDDVPAVDGGWEYEVVPKPGAWRNEPVFLINLPARRPDTDGLSSDAMTLELDFSFKADQANEHYEVPIVLFKSVGVNERLRIDGLPPYQQYERILLAQALALHYIARLHDPHQPPVRFVTRLWFETIYAAITRGQPLRIGGRVAQIIASVFDNDPPSASHFAGATAQVRQLAWHDKDDLDQLLDADNCPAAKALIDYLTVFNSDHSNDAAAERLGDGPEVIAGMKDRYKGRCVAVVNSSANPP